MLVAPLGVAIAGFAGIVSAFHPQRAWGPPEFVRLQSLVIASLAVTFSALWPVVVLFATTDQTDLWRIGSATQILYVGQIRIRRLRALRRAGRTWRELAPWYVDVPFYPLQIINLFNIALWGSFAPYAAGVLFQLWVASAFFYSFVLDIRRPETIEAQSPQTAEVPSSPAEHSSHVGHPAERDLPSSVDARNARTDKKQ